MRILLDENLRSAALWRAIQAAQAANGVSADIVRVGDPSAPPLSSSDEFIVSWAAQEGRVLVSQDRRTLEQAVAVWIAAGQHAAGVALLRRRIPLPIMAEIILLIALATDEAEWRNAVQWFP